jgi:P-type Cu2+ transporter
MRVDTLTPPVSGQDASTTTASTNPSATTSCTHCALPVPAGLLVAERTHQFCCHGCEAAYELIHGQQLDDYYAICQQLEARPQPGADPSESFADFDHTAFQARYVRLQPDGSAAAILLVHGLHCAACVWLLEKLPQIVPGVLAAEVDLARRSIRLRWDSTRLALSQIARQLARLGYPVRPSLPTAARARERVESRRQLIQLAIAGACAGNAMLLAIALYAGWFSGIAAEHLHLLRGVSAILGMISLLGPGATFYRGAWVALKTGTPHMDISLTLGLVAGGAMGLINTLRGSGEIYFDSLCMLIFVLLIGRTIQSGQQRRAAERVAVLRSLIPRTARRLLPTGEIETVPVEALDLGDVVEVRVGDALPADGAVTLGQSELDQSLLTGESTGVPVTVGAAVPAGAINLSGPLQITLTAVGESTRVGRLSALVESASLGKAPLVDLANRVSGLFLWVVLGLAVVTLVAWWPLGMERAVDCTIALLIVACPCALGLATPLTLAVAVGQAAQRGILIRGGDVFERLNQPGTLWLDKTGTLTTGQMALMEWRGDRSVAPLVVALQRGIVHPIARGLTAALEPECQNGRHLDAESTYIPGLGVRGLVDSLPVAAGSRRLMESLEIDLADEPVLLVAAPPGATPVYIAIDQELVAIAWLGDRPRPEAAEAVAGLRAAGWRVGMLSGDRPELARAVAVVVGIAPADVIAGVLPEEKLAVVRDHRGPGPVVMVGDGVNDSAALAAADVGIAVQGGAEASLQAAKVYLAQPGLNPLVELFEGSRGAMRAIRNGLKLSLGYNVLAVTLATFGQITPLAAAILMPLSSLSVIALATLQPGFRSRS